MRIRWTAPAAEALQRVIDYIERDNPPAAHQVAQQIKFSVRQLSDHPRLGRKGRVRGTRELVIHGVSYIVPYRVERDEVQILSVYHTSRKWPQSFD